MIPIRREMVSISAKLMLITAAGLTLMAVAAAASDAPQQKIDPALATQMSAAGDEKIPVIVILNGEGNPALKDLEVKYKFRLIHGVAGEATPSAIKSLAKSDSVLGVYPDSTTNLDYPSNGSFSSAGGHLFIPATAINADRLWQKGIDGKGVTVAVIDSGIDKNHPDLAGKVIGEKNFVEGEATTDDLLGHGTMVAGIIAGSGVSSGGKYRGIAPGANLLNVKVINSKGDGRVSDIIAGIEWALYNGADVLSLSLGGINLGETNPPITMAADNAMDEGAVVCVAAGNRNNTNNVSGQINHAATSSFSDPIDVSQLGRPSKDVLLLLVPIVLALPPGLIDSPGDGVKVITVGASDYQGHVADFSGSGPTRDDRTKPDVVAPGVDIVSTVPPGIEKLDYVDAYYARESGTSLSTPVAAGMAALLLQEREDLTPAGVKAVMTRGAEKLRNTLGEEYEEYYQGAGLLDAVRSSELLRQDICYAVPDKWVAGRWAYLPAGRGLYVGLNAGADRPQKKLYALAPGDQDWTTNLVFFTDQERNNLKTSVSGSISDWISLQPLPKSLPANGQQVFAASMTVPEGTAPGVYSGSIRISEGEKDILNIPVSAEVAAPINITKGTASAEGTLKGSEWRYYYLDVPLGTNDLDASLMWNETSSLDLFLLAPTSEYYAGEPTTAENETGHDAVRSIENPPSGRWLLAVHSENSSVPVSYTLDIERSLVETSPKRWIVGSVAPGTIERKEFIVENKGRALENLSYMGVIENTSSQVLEDSVGYKETWEKAVNVSDRTRRLSARLTSTDQSNKSEVLLVLEDPQGEPADATLGSGDLGPVEVSDPEEGTWKVKVYGYDVPDSGLPFSVTVTEDSEDEWSWIQARGPTGIDSDSNGTLEAELTIPRNASVPRLDGQIEIVSGNQTFQIPVSVAVAGNALLGLVKSKAEDDNSDGYFERLILGFGVNITVPGSYRLEGTLTDCRGRAINMIDSIGVLRKSGEVNVTVNGSEIWKKGECGPLEVQNLILYDSSGNLVDRYQGNITIEKDPKQFQPPLAYFTDGFVNMTTGSEIAVGVNISVVKPGRYKISGTIVNDSGEEMGKDSVEKELEAGNATIPLEFNPTKFMITGHGSRLHLDDLVLSRNGVDLDHRSEAWSSERMRPEGFSSGLQAVGSGSAGGNNSSKRGDNGTSGVMRIVGGGMVIS
ncbi:MAG TPA: S8 family serine peptidase [Methanothrix sp.]|nr:S8 family serine peptidase [Methanothrix sp.]